MVSLSLLSLIAVAAASPIDSYLKDLDKRDVSANQLSGFKFYVQHAAAAYCNVDASAGDLVTCSGTCPDVQGDRAMVIDGFDGWVTGIGGYVAVDHARREVVLSVRGSHNVRNFITDIVFSKTDCDFTSGCEVHAGFNAAWNEIAGDAYRAIGDALGAWPSYRLVATGHSLGAAVATLAAADLRRSGYSVDLYTYGSPRVGNDAFANFVTRQPGAEYRVTHLDDPVPRLPPIIFGYRHTSPEYWLFEGGATTENYGTDDVKVCPGIANTNCNAGTFGLDVDAHLHYFEDVSGCGSSGLQFKRDVSSDEELRDRLNKWSAEDQKFVKGE